MAVKKKFTFANLILLLALAAISARAQFSGYTLPYGDSEPGLIAAATGATTKQIAHNIGQISHLAIYRTTGSPTQVAVVIEGSSTGGAGTWLPISTTGTRTDVGGIIAVTFLPYIRINVQALSGGTNPTITVDYYGTADINSFTGIFSSSNNNNLQILSFTDAANASHTYKVSLPASGTFGMLVLSYSVADCAASGLQITAGADPLHQKNLFPAAAASNFAELGQTTDVQLLPVPPTPSITATVTYTTGCVAATSKFYLAYVFSPSPSSLTCNNKAAISLTGSGDTRILTNNSLGGILVICHLDLSAASGVVITLDEGTGTNCGTGTVSDSGDYQNVATAAFDYNPPLVIGRGNDFCIKQGTGVTTGGMVLYSNY